eukprot:590245-Rhodomonas_salina.1
MDLHLRLGTQGSPLTPQKAGVLDPAWQGVSEQLQSLASPRTPRLAKSASWKLERVKEDQVLNAPPYPPVEPGAQPTYFVCDHGCGFGGTFSLVEAHEKQCRHPKQQTLQQTQSPNTGGNIRPMMCDFGCGFQGPFDVVARHEHSCNLRRRSAVIQNDREVNKETPNNSQVPQRSASTPPASKAPVFAKLITDVKKENSAARFAPPRLELVEGKASPQAAPKASTKRHFSDATTMTELRTNSMRKINVLTPSNA